MSDGRDKERVQGVEGGGREKKGNRRAMGVGREANLGNREQKLFSSVFLPLGCFGHEPQCCGGDDSGSFVEYVYTPYTLNTLSTAYSLGCV